MVTVKEKRLEIKSHSDELLKEVEDFMKNRPQFPIKPSVSKVERELKDRADFLRRVLRQNKA
ncbi:MAG: hypothetical protein R3267_07770 [Paenisporosarcina sp.]|nr:hypothetical protein [Paenisporosarcina sp.]